MPNNNNLSFTMKKIPIILCLLALAIPGCFTDNSVNPDFGIQGEKNFKNWIQSDESGVIELQKETQLVQSIDGQSGGKIVYDVKVARLRVSGELIVPENSFEGVVDVSTLFNSKNTTQTFGPSPFTFEKTLLLTLEYKGVNLKNVNPDEIDFYYIDNSGQFHKAEYSSITVDTAEGVLKVENAKINHFSRWGWAK
jgi:hypothetical protein